MPTIGSLFSGAGLLDLGLHLAGFEHGWLCESDPWRRDLLRARFPGAIVYDDIRTLRGQAAADTTGGLPRCNGSNSARRLATELERGARDVDLIAGGFPCKGASSAGKQNGFEHTETVLWHEMRRVIGELRPRVVLIENVRDVLSVALAPGEPPGSLWGAVLADLAALGFDATWDCLPAAAVGAPHLRDRVFCVATHPARLGAPHTGGDRRGGIDARRVSAIGGREAAAHAGIARLEGRDERNTGGEEVPEPSGGRAITGAAPDTARDAEGGTGTPTGTYGERAGARTHVAVDWGEYAPAIGRWEAIQGAAPEPLVRRMDDGDPKLSRVRARVDRSRLSALGDGVHVYCAWLVGRHVMGLLEGEAVAT